MEIVVYDTNNQPKMATSKYEQEGRFCLGVAKVESKEDMIVTCRKKGGTTRMRAHVHARTFTNPGALGPDIKEVTVNRRPLQALLLLPWSGARPATGPGAI